MYNPIDRTIKAMSVGAGIVGVIVVTVLFLF